MNLRIVNCVIKESEIVAHAGLKKLDILGHHADAAAIALQPYTGWVDPANAELTTSRVIEAQEQTRQGALATAGPSQHTQDMPWL